MTTDGIREKEHRLSREHYTGRTSAAFTLCVQQGAPLFIESAVVTAFTDFLASVTTQSHCIVPVYCFMPDHQHIIVSGTSDSADLWKVIVAYKQRTGFWLSRHIPAVKWQKDFYDHIIRSDRNLATQVRYILDNPVRKGLTATWQEHPYKGSIGCELDTILSGIS